MKQTVWITGGSRGIGAACVRAFAQAGWRVAFSYLKSGDAAEKLAAETGALAVQADMSAVSGRFTRRTACWARWCATRVWPSRRCSAT